MGGSRNLTFDKFFFFSKKDVPAFQIKRVQILRFPASFLFFCDKSGSLGRPPDPVFFPSPELFVFVPDFLHIPM